MYSKMIQVFFQAFHYKLLQDIEHNSLLYSKSLLTISCRVVSINFTVLIYSSSPFGNHKFVFRVCECLFCKLLVLFFRFHI